MGFETTAFISQPVDDDVCCPLCLEVTPVLLVLLLVLLVQLNCRLQFLKIKILLLVSSSPLFTPAVTVGDDLLVKFDSTELIESSHHPPDEQVNF